MKRAVRQIAALAGLLAVFCTICRFAMAGGYTLYIPPWMQEDIRAEEIRFEAEKPETVRIGEPVVRDGRIEVKVYGGRAGETGLDVYDGNGNVLYAGRISVGLLGTVYDYSSGGFTGDSLLMIGVTAFWLAACAIMIWNFRQAKGTAFYSYASIYFAGFSLFALSCAVEMLNVTVAHLINPASYSMSSVYGIINGASMLFLVFSAPAVFLFAAAMGISNIALMRHEGPRIRNALGILIGTMMIAGETIGIILYTRDFMGSEWELRVTNTIQNTYATVFVYFECMLAGSAICGIRAAKHQPAMDKDCILILGCGFRKDGTLPPLLRGRADRAIGFWRQQKEETGKEAVMIPSGGQGADEIMPEGEAIRRYLAEQGIPEDKIRPETESVNTYQNMLFSKKIVEELDQNSKVIFATTNYHVFRSGVWATEAGLEAEGIGSRTKWWFWPNAFMRECTGLLRKRWKQEVLFLFGMAAFYALLSMALF